MNRPLGEALVPVEGSALIASADVSQQDGIDVVASGASHRATDAGAPVTAPAGPSPVPGNPSAATCAGALAYIRVEASDLDDTVEVFSSTAGLLIGVSGSDAFVGGDGADAFEGGSDGVAVDTVSYAGRSTRVVADIDGQLDDGADADGDTEEGDTIWTDSGGTRCGLAPTQSS